MTQKKLHLNLTNIIKDNENFDRYQKGFYFDNPNSKNQINNTQNSSNNHNNSTNNNTQFSSKNIDFFTYN